LVFSGEHGIPFALKYMSTVAFYQDNNLKNANSALIELYRLQRENEKFQAEF
jgi:hypothetical protein